MTTYGTIPTSSPSTELNFISRTNQRVRYGLGTRRPWREMFRLRAFALPSSVGDAVVRSRDNAVYFRMNYAIIVLLVVFLGLLWHPISLVVLAAMMAAWLVLYFLRDDPLEIFGRTIGDGIILAVLSVSTVVFLLLTKATVNILVSLLVGLVMVFFHATFRTTDDLFEDTEALMGHTPSLHGSGAVTGRTPLKDAASSFSAI